MKLLIITQKVDINDDNLGFLHRWLEKIAQKVEELHVVCLSIGEHHLPKNIRVYSLGKEQGYSKLRQFSRLQKFLFKNLSDIDSVFVHMCPIYAVSSFPLVKIFRKKMILWFLHKEVNWQLRLAEKCVDKVLTASKESCRLKNRKKIEVVGHGIDTEFFKPGQNINNTNKFKILSVGRISPVKDQKTLVLAADVLVNQKNIENIEIKFLGTPLEKQEKAYFERLKELVKEKQLRHCVEFLGGISHNQMPQYYQNTDLVVSLSHTDSIDKVVLEAMACAAPVLTCNEAFFNILDEKYLFPKKDFQSLAGKIINLKGIKKDANLREVVIKNHNLDKLIEKIIQRIKNE